MKDFIWGFLWTLGVLAVVFCLMDYLWGGAR